jgi:DNA primase
LTSCEPGFRFSEVVGQRVKLRKAGREWKGLSPFNREKIPSFFVNDQSEFHGREER